MYHSRVPKLWSETIDAHRRAVHDAILETTWALVQRRGVLSVTMSEIAADAGIGRATLYKYFPDVESILMARHQRHVAEHVDGLKRLRDEAGTPGDRLEAVLHEYGRICHHRGRHGADELLALLHKGEDVLEAEAEIHELLTQLLADAADARLVRDDLDPGGLAAYCRHAVSAASRLADEDAVRRLVAITLDGLRPPRPASQDFRHSPP
jgi:AcrR family transcriptional regulator